jgi:hypothetical protein
VPGLIVANWVEGRYDKLGFKFQVQRLI